jgi:hypothetical protein
MEEFWRSGVKIAGIHSRRTWPPQYRRRIRLLALFLTISGLVRRVAAAAARQ